MARVVEFSYNGACLWRQFRRRSTSGCRVSATWPWRRVATSRSRAACSAFRSRKSRGTDARAPVDSPTPTNSTASWPQVHAHADRSEGVGNTHTHAHTHTESHTHTYTHQFNGPFPGLPRWASTRKIKPIWILLKQETVSGSGISWAYASLYLNPDR